MAEYPSSCHRKGATEVSIETKSQPKRRAKDGINSCQQKTAPQGELGKSLYYIGVGPGAEDHLKKLNNI